MKKTATAILMGLSLITIVPAANAEIASKDYVDELGDKHDNFISMMWGDYGAQLDAMSKEQVEQVLESDGLADAGYMGFIIDQVSELGDVVGDDTMATTAQTVTGAVNELKTAVDGKMDSMTVEATPTANSTNLVTSGGVAAAIANAVTIVDANPTSGSNNAVSSGGVYNALTTMEDNFNLELNKAVGMSHQVGNGIVVTDNNGKVKVATGGFITNDKISSSAAIEMGKMAFPTPPAACETAGCMLMYVQGKYTWEVVTRDNNESVTVVNANSVNATPTTTNTSTNRANPASCQVNGGYWDESTGGCTVML